MIRQKCFYLSGIRRMYVNACKTRVEQSRLTCNDNTDRYARRDTRKRGEPKISIVGGKEATPNQLT